MNDPLEQTQRLSRADRRARAFEAQVIHEHERRAPDFRDGRREYRLTPLEIAQQDGGDRE